MTEIRKPCATCPWRVDQDATVIPNYRHELAEGLANTSPDERGFGPDFGSPQFACHQSTDEKKVVCSGWLAMVGHRHPAVRMSVMTGRTPGDALEPGPDWPELHETFQQVIEKLRATNPEED